MKNKNTKTNTKYRSDTNLVERAVELGQTKKQNTAGAYDKRVLLFNEDSYQSVLQGQ